MNAHECFALPASARVSLYQNEQLAVWDRLNTVTGKTEISFKNLRDFSPPDIALALHTHVKGASIKNLKIKWLRKSIADRLLGISGYRSGEANQHMLLKESALLKIAPPAATVTAGPDDADEITRIINTSFASSSNSRVCPKWVSEDMFQAGWFSIFLMVDGKKAGFGSAIHEKGHGEVNWVCLLPEFQGKGHGKALMNELLKELSSRSHPFMALGVESKNSKALKFYESYGFRWDNDLYFNIYG